MNEDSEPSVNNTADLSIVLCGQAGMGIQTVEILLTRICRSVGYHLFTTSEYMSRIRGGANSTDIRLSSEPVGARIRRMDILVPLHKSALRHVQARITPQTLVLADPDTLQDEIGRYPCRYSSLPLASIALEIGGAVFSNLVAVGALAGLLGIPLSSVLNQVRSHFAAKSTEVGQKNEAAAQRGYAIGSDLVKLGSFRSPVVPRAGKVGNLLLDGAEAVALGAIAGGCNFLAAYPMSPSTGVLTFLAQHAAEFGIAVEQAEDEIAGMNMAIGAWYAGARALVSTSGGGFALMSEGLSLAGMVESPLVIHLAQRPGPATGLPTRTEQADLELALYAGHGEFPRAIFAPGTLADAFELTRRAFTLADRSQCPVFVLTDQSLIDCSYDFAPPDLTDIRVEPCIVKTGVGYKRFALTDDGLSPRGIPGFGEGLVVVDSDEHDEEGHITEDAGVRTKMVDKRLRKLDLLKKQIVPPTLWPDGPYSRLVVCWGSTFAAVREAVARLAVPGLSLLHFGQVYPLHADTAPYLKRAQRVGLIENNATGQFGKLVRQYTGFKIESILLKYDGLGFSVEDIVEGIQKWL
jgi:2-oxoglutarate/2-oxoacid ferredoxin oxidoreductase subunit alpha